MRTVSRLWPGNKIMRNLIMRDINVRLVSMRRASVSA
jgi:hypothetical protein